jgi:hypothetical protein
MFMQTVRNTAGKDVVEVEMVRKKRAEVALCEDISCVDKSVGNAAKTRNYRRCILAPVVTGI